MKSKKRNFAFVLFLLFFGLTWFGCGSDDEFPLPVCSPPDSVYIISYSFPDNAPDTLDIGWTEVGGATGYRLVISDSMSQILINININDGGVTNFQFITDIDLSGRVPLEIEVSTKCQEEESLPNRIYFDLLICDDEVGKTDNIDICTLSTQCKYIQLVPSISNTPEIVYDRVDFCNCLNSATGSTIFSCARSRPQIHVGRPVVPSCN